MLFSTGTILLSLSTLSAQATEASLLAAVPEDATALAYCQDFAALRSRALRNDWFGLLNSSHGEPLLQELEQEFRMQTHTQMDGLYAMLGAIQGESVFFTSETLAGFVTEPPTARDELSSAMRAWLPEPGTEGIRRDVQVLNAQVSLAAWPGAGSEAWEKRIGHYAAFVDHPEVLGLFSGNDLESLMAGIEATIANTGTDHRSPLVESFLGARTSAAARGGIEFFVDFSSLVPEAEAMLASAGEGFLPDPAGMLGLEEDTWLHVTADVFPGQRLDCSAFLNIPKGTLAASLADTFGALPADTPGRLPKDLWSVYALQWDMGAFYRIARNAFIEEHGEESVAMVDAGLSAAQAMSGVDPMKEFLELLDGTFTVYFTEDEAVETTPHDEFDELGLLFGLKNGEAFLDAFEQLIGSVGLESELDMQEIEGADVFTMGDGGDGGLDDDFFGGIAFLPDAFVLAFGRSTLERSLRAAQRKEGSTALDDETVLRAFNENSGACFLSCVALRALQLRQFKELGPAEEATGEGQVSASPFDSVLTSSVHRTPEGMRFQIGTR